MSSVSSRYVKVTKGMQNALGKLQGSGRSCASCGVEVPRYTGNYPKSCPSCGELIITKAGSVIQKAKSDSA